MILSPTLEMGECRLPGLMTFRNALEQILLAEAHPRVTTFLKDFSAIPAIFLISFFEFGILIKGGKV
jgi:hypothetical protein